VTNAAPSTRTRRRWPVIAGAVLLVLVAVVALWDWNWFRPLVASRASAALGRPVTLANFSVRLGWVTQLVADQVVIANPPDFPAEPPFARAQRLTVNLDLGGLLRERSLVLPVIELDQPMVEARRLANGTTNWNFPALTAGPASPGAEPRIGDVRITDGHAHVVDPQLKSDFQLDVVTKEGATKEEAAKETATKGAAVQPGGTAAPGGIAVENAHIVVEARGTYAGQPISGNLVGGALLSLRDKDHPYPIDLHLANGATHLTITGTVAQPLSFAGANIRLQVAGSDMANLYPLTGVPLPPTPPFQFDGHLDYADRRIHFDHFTGRLGSSDVAGSLNLDPGQQRPVLNATMESRQVDLVDFGGFIGATPGRATTPGQSPAQRQALAQATASPKLLPQTQISLPKVQSIDVHLQYHGAHIAGRSVPLDNVSLTLDMVNGDIHLHPLSFAVGRGTIQTDLELAPSQQAGAVRAHAAIDFRQVDLSRLMSATHAFQGQGTIGGHGDLTGTGSSTAQILADSDGDVQLFMNGGDLSALLVDLSGLEFGNALMSALGIPNRAKVECLIADLPVQHGQMQARSLLVATDEANVTGGGTVNLVDETMNLELRTESKHFSIGSLPAPVLIGGTLKNPSVRPGAEMAARGGAAVGLGVLFPPLALLPTIQLGLGENNACATTMQQVQANAGKPGPATPAADKPAAGKPAVAKPTVAKPTPGQTRH
jgi:uncharacterized protein involved in outer membrane biogenesis